MDVSSHYEQNEDHLTKNSTSFSHQGRNAARNQCIFELTRELSLKPSHISELKVSDLFYENRFIFTRRKNGSISVKPISDRLAKTIKAWVESQNLKNDDYVFISERRTKINRRTIWHIVRTENNPDI